MKFKIIKFDNNDIFPQTIDSEIIKVSSYEEINKVSADYILIMDTGWDFTKVNSVEILLRDINTNSYAFGFYSDVKINNIYKNNLPYSIETIQKEEIMSPAVIKGNLAVNYGDFNSSSQVLKAIGQKFILYRSPNILFSYNK